jgi:hypothetical protein
VGFKESLLTALGKRPEEAEKLSEEDALKLLVEEMRKPPEAPKTANEPETTEEPKTLTTSDIEKVLSDIRGLNSEAARQKMTEVMNDLRQSNAELQQSLRLSEAHGRVKQLMEGTRGYVPTIPQQEELLKLLVEAPKPIADRIFTLFTAIKDKGLVELAERGRTSTDVDLSSLSDDPVSLFMKKVEIAKAEYKLSEVEAYSRVSSDNPDLYAKYTHAVDVNQGVGR